MSNDRLGDGRVPSAARALLWAFICALGMALTWVAASLVPVSHLQDAVALRDFTELSRPRIDLPANALLSLLNPPLYTTFSAALILVALIRRRPRVAVAVAGVLSAAPLSCELLKPLLAHPHVQLAYVTITDASWPSGHATAAMSLMLCCLLIAPRHMRRPLAIIGVLFVLAVGFSLLVLAWHMPSDVFAGYLLAALWCALAVAALRYSRERSPQSTRRPSSLYRSPRSERRLVTPMLVATLAAVVGLAAVTVAARHAGSFALDHRALLVAAVGISALAIVIAGALTAALRR